MQLIVWFILAIIFSVVEIIIPTLITIWFAIASLLMILVSIFIKDILIEIVIFLIISFILLISTRNFSKKFLKKNQFSSDMIGDVVVVTNKITDFDYEVRFKATIWTAVSNDEIFEVGDNVSILDFSGNKIILGKKILKFNKGEV